MMEGREGVLEKVQAFSSLRVRYPSDIVTRRLDMHTRKCFTTDGRTKE